MAWKYQIKLKRLMTYLQPQEFFFWVYALEKLSNIGFLIYIKLVNFNSIHNDKQLKITYKSINRRIDK